MHVHHRDGDSDGQAAGMPYSAPTRAGLQDTGQAAPAYPVKLGPIGARRLPAGSSFGQQNSRNVFIFRRFRRFQQAGKNG